MSVDFEMRAGETPEYAIVVTRTDPATGAVTNINLTGGELRFAMQARGAASPLVVKNSTVPTEIAVSSSPPYNTATVFFVGADTNGITADTVFDYTLRLHEAAGDVTDIAAGKILVRPAIATTP